MTKAATKNPNRPRKKIGEREELIVEKLTPAQIDAAKSRVCDLLRTKDDLEAKIATAKADNKAKLKAIESEIKSERAMASTGRRETEVIVEEWLTEGNEVVRVRADTGEQLGRRTARVEELQTELFKDDTDTNADDAAAIAESAEGAAEAGDDFGDS